MPEDLHHRVDPGLATLLSEGVAEDWVDRRDRFFAPPLAVLPERLEPHRHAFPEGAAGRPAFGVRDQGTSGRCVGYALAALVDIQRHIRAGATGRHPDGIVSADMLYHMARFHDRYTARPDGRRGLADPGSGWEGVRTLRSVIKGFYHHGACLDHPDDPPVPADRWRSAAFGLPDCGTQQRLLTAAQARAARGLVLGAYYRLRPVLHDYHAALAEAGAILVSARVGGAWRRPGAGRIPWSEETVAAEGHHAFVLVGYDAEGFLVLNSWGERWGGFGDRPGVAHWGYHDWGANVVDAWVLRLGVPAPSAFEMSVGEHGPSRVHGPVRAGSMPCQELMGHYLHLDDGRHVETHSYPSDPEMTAAMLGELEARAGCPGHRGAVLWLPGSLEPMRQGFELAVARRAWFEALGLHPITIFWCNDFAQHVMGVLREVIADCVADAGAGAAHLDAMIEARAHGLGRALWRDIEGSARRSVAGRDRRGAPWRDVEASGHGEPGPLRPVLEGLMRHADMGHELHVVAEGAGVLVLDEMLRARGGAALGGRITSLALSLPAIPLTDEAGGRGPSEALLDLVRRINGAGACPAAGASGGPDVLLGRGGVPAPRLAAERAPRARPRARIYVPHKGLERRIRFEGYGRSVLHLVATSFMGSFDVRRRGPAPTLLGMAAATGLRREIDGVTTLGLDDRRVPTGPIEQAALSLHPDLEAEMLAAVRDHSQPVPAGRPT